MWRLLAICILTTTLSAMAQSPALSDRDWKRWLDEVSPLLTAAEKTEAAKSPAQERETFRDAFWARRTPTGQGPENQQRAEYELRVRTADKRFRDGSKWNDCGRAFVLLGQPDRISNRASATHFAGNNRLGAFRDQDDVEAETWLYRNPVRLPPAPEGYVFHFTGTCESVNGPSFQRLLQTVAASYLLAR